jgi:hypothetical protein
MVAGDLFTPREPDWNAFPLPAWASRAYLVSRPIRLVWRWLSGSAARSGVARWPRTGRLLTSLVRAGSRG